MYIFRFFSKILVFLLVIGLLQAATEDTLKEAYKDVEQYLAKASMQDKKNFAHYLKYYRAEGRYQAVQPAPRSLRESLSSAARTLFRKLTKRARKFTRTPQPIPGASRLTSDGEKFYESIRRFVEKSIFREPSPKIVSAK